MIIHNYPKEFIERTLRLLDECYSDAKDRELEVTFLLNCLLGLIVATSEQLGKCKGDFFSKKLNDKDVIDYIPDKIGQVDLNHFLKSYKEQINKKSLINQLEGKFEINSEIQILQNKKTNNDLTLKNFIKSIRNGVAHQNLMATSQSDHWEGVRIWNHTNQGIKDFEVEFTILQLKKFAVFIAEKFIEFAPER